MYGLRRIAFRVAGSCTPYVSTFSKPRLLNTSALPILRSLRLTQSSYFRRTFASEAEKDELPSQGEAAAATSAQEEAAMPTQETPEGLEEMAEVPKEEPLQPDTTSAELFNVGEIERAEPAATEDVTSAAIGELASPVEPPSATESATKGSPAPVPGAAIYVGNLYFEVTNEDLKTHFSSYGSVTEVNIVKDMRGVSRGYGFVHFSTAEAAKQAREGEDSQPFKGRRLAVRPSLTLEERERERASGRGPRQWFNTPQRAPGRPSRTLFVGNLSYDMTDRDLNELFRDIRGVLDVRVAIDRQTGQPRGFAHADFTDVATATAAKAVLETKNPHGRHVKVDFSTSRGRPDDTPQAQ